MQGSVEARQAVAGKALQRRGARARHPWRAWARSPKRTCMLASARRTPSSSASTCVRTTPCGDIAEREKVDIRLYRVIYNAIEDVEKAMKGLLAPQVSKKPSSARAQVRQTFKVTGVGTIAGCYVTDGKIQCATRPARLLRDNVVIHGRQDRFPQALSRTTPARWARAMSAALAWRAITTSRKATSSSASPWRKLSAKVAECFSDP